MTQHDDLETMRRAYEAFNQGDIPAVLAAFDEQIEWHEPGYALRFLDPEIWTTIVWANFQERIVSQPLPEGCSPGEITRV